MKAAIFREVGKPLTIEEVEVDRPMPREVLIRTVATGVCHSDFHFVEGTWPLPAPAVLGHEGAGIVEAVGDQVSYVKPGDRVITCPSTFCGTCNYCTSGRPALCDRKGVTRSADQPPRYRLDGKPLFQFSGLGTYAEQMLVHEHSIVKIGEDFPLDRAALLGCGVTTGLGAVFNTARIEAGSTVAVFGAGGIGLSCIQGARIAGASMIIAVDVSDSKLATAKEMGATHLVNSKSENPVKAIKALTDGGVEYSFEAIGLKQTAEQAYECLARGGAATIIGMVPVKDKIEISGASLLDERKLQGSRMGSNRFRRDMPIFIDFYRQGRLKLDQMITRRGRLADINEAYRAMKAGEVARSVLTFD